VSDPLRYDEDGHLWIHFGDPAPSLTACGLSDTPSPRTNDLRLVTCPACLAWRPQLVEVRRPLILPRPVRWRIIEPRPGPPPVRRKGQQSRGRRHGSVFPLRLTDDVRAEIEAHIAAGGGPRSIGPWLLWAALRRGPGIT
jgi:hypothetical protein